MKLLIKSLAVVALFFTFTFAATAQRGDRQPKDPAAMAEKQTTRMVENLSLDTQQAAQIQAINLKYAQKMQEVRKNNEGGREAMKEIRAAINTEKDAEIQQALTEEQFQTYTEMQAKKEKKKGKGKRGKKKGSEGSNR